MAEQRGDLYRLVEEPLESRTVEWTITLLKSYGLPDEVIKEELRSRHGLNELQASESLREYRELNENSAPDFPPCPTCGKPIINNHYCINCGTFIKDP